MRFIHRKLQDSEIYFITNSENHPTDFVATFRHSGYKGAEIWDPVTGTRKGVELTEDGDVQKVAMHLEEYGSAFVVLRNDALETRNLAVAATVEVTGPWRIDFEAESGNPAFSMDNTSLMDWAESADDNVKYFSGTAHYSSKFDVAEEAEQYVLDLGKVMVMAKVRINGTYAGGVWTMPYTLDITPFVQPGENTIEVDVVNNWINRLVGDNRLPESERGTWTYNNPAKDGAELQSSGLLGPVKVTAFK